MSNICYYCGHEGCASQEVEMYASYNEDGEPIKNGPTYKHIEVYCPECGRLMTDEDVDKENRERKRKAEREYFGLVSYEDLLKLPKKYGVPRETINIILGFEGEQALTEAEVIGVSLWDGEIPSTDESNRIKKALSDPKYFLDCMDKVKENLPKEFYERVRPRIEKMK